MEKASTCTLLTLSSCKYCVECSCCDVIFEEWEDKMNMTSIINQCFVRCYCWYYYYYHSYKQYDHNHVHDQHRTHHNSYLIYLIWFHFMLLIAFLCRHGQCVLLRFDSDWNPQVRSLFQHCEHCSVGTCLSLHARSFHILFLSSPFPLFPSSLLYFPLPFPFLLSFPLLSPFLIPLPPPFLYSALLCYLSVNLPPIILIFEL